LMNSSNFFFATDRIADYLPFLFAWSPVLNPIVVMYFVKDLRPGRNLLIFKLKSIATAFPNKTNAGQNTIYFLQKPSEGRNSNLPKNDFVTKAITAVSGI
uniref:G_PROTEIN_RECEP_F1_2 domain-containing protein n=1 Tax=Haemonchus placei TaxID=6290 RepID=A0A0N4W7S0_HAEPC